MYVRRNIDIVRYIKIYAPYIHILKSLFIIHISKKNYFSKFISNSNVQ